MIKTMLFLLLFLLSALGAKTIDVAVAANVSYAMNALKKAFTSMHPETGVRVTLGSSGKLTAQIKNGAPYGLFMSANMKYPHALYDDGLAAMKPVVYAQGALALLSVRPKPFDRGIKTLKETAIDKIAISNPKTAPYGAAAVEAIRSSGIYDVVKHKFVYAETVSQVVAYTFMAADVGIVAKSSLYSPKLARFRQGVNWVAVDPSLYTPIKQGIVLLKQGEDNQEYRAFYDFMLDKQAARILQSFGYLIP